MRYARNVIQYNTWTAAKQSTAPQGIVVGETEMNFKAEFTAAYSAARKSMQGNTVYAVSRILGDDGRTATTAMARIFC